MNRIITMIEVVAVKCKPIVNSVLVSLAMLPLFQIPLTNADVLTTPAMNSSMAAHSLLLDVVKAGKRLVAIGERGHIIYSDDQEQSWQQAKVPVSTLLTAVDFVDERHGWAVGHGAIVLHSSDSGETWVVQMDGNLANEMVVAQAQLNVSAVEKALTAASDEQLEDLEYALEDAQFALEDAQIDAEVGPSKPLLDVWFKDANTGFVVGAYGFFFKTSDGGTSWENWGDKIENADRFHLNAIQPIAEGLLFIVGESGNIFKSTDLGDTWETIDSPYDGSLFGVTGNGRADELFIFGLRGNIFFSDSAGATWTRIKAGAQESLMNAAVGDNGEMVIIGNSGVMLLSDDYGMSFQLQTREDRLAILGANFLSPARLLLVGENGASIVKDLDF